jgi:ADP-ribosylglycohydrolase
MLGAIAGDIIGSMYEKAALKSTLFPLFDTDSRFTDDTVLTVAVADWLLHGGELVDRLHDYFDAYPNAGYGGTFIRWAQMRMRQPYQSWGNGSAMRVSPVAWVSADLETVLARAKESAAVTHDHPEGIKGAQATAAAIFLARTGHDKAAIRQYVEGTFGYDLGEPLSEIRLRYRFDVTCQGSVPQSLIAFLEANNFEEAVRNAISLGGDADTMACIAGAVAEAFYGGVPEVVTRETLQRLDEPLRSVTEKFRARYC